MADSSNILRYLRECYRENGSRGGLWNVFSSSVQNRLFVEEQDLPIVGIDGSDPTYLRDEAAEKACQQAHIYRKEKDLVYATVFLLGWVNRSEEEPEAICAPLFLYPAMLETREVQHGAVIRLDLEHRQINFPILEAAGGEAFARSIEDNIDASSLTEGCVGEIRTRFEEAFPGADGSALLEYPHLLSGREVRRRFHEIKKDNHAPFVLLPAAAIALINKSTEMRGVLNELEEMAAPETTLSPPVAALLGAAPKPAAAAPPGRVPAILSRSQEQILASARERPLTLAIGPPGTGKSFTIAALAIETLSRGGSVLVASKMDHAVDVVGDKIESALGLEGVVVRGGRRQYMKRLKEFIDGLLSGLHTIEAPNRRQIRQFTQELHRIEKQIRRGEENLQRRLARETRWGRVASLRASSFVRRWRQRAIAGRVEKQPPLWQVAADFEHLTDHRISRTVEFLQQWRKHHLHQALLRSRERFQKLGRALRARTGGKQETYFREAGLEQVLEALPIWLVNLSDVHRILPLQCGAFDLAIIDEATQCDMASALPILQRGRRAVITGDPQQLRHLSFLRTDRQQALAEQFSLDEEQRERFDFREVSLLDLASDRIGEQSQVGFLNEHFRSRPEIIGFSNAEFYSGRLHIMTGHRRNELAPEMPVRITRLKGATRDTNGVNRGEADAVLRAVETVCAEQESLPAGEPLSIGILSPFRNQVDYLRRSSADSAAAGPLMERHDLLIGTAHTFQGEERDLMFISLSLDDESPATSFNFIDKRDLFNVTVTRACLQNRVYLSFDPAALSRDSLLYRYLAYAGSLYSRPAQPGGPAPEGFGDFLTIEGDSTGLSAGPDPVDSSRAAEIHDQFARDVAKFLRAAGARVSVGFPFAGSAVDLIYTLGEKTRAIDLVGFPGAFQEAFPLERLLTFRRAGLEILPLSYLDWLFRRDACEVWLLGK